MQARAQFKKQTKTRQNKTKPRHNKEKTDEITTGKWIRRNSWDGLVTFCKNYIRG